MTVPAAARKAGPFNGNGSTTSFPFTFKVFTDEDIEVVYADADGVESVLTLDSDYSVSLNADQDASPGGSVTYPISGSPLASGRKLSIAGALAYEQETDIPTGGNFNPTVLENALDKLSMQTQQLAEGLERAAKLPITNAGDAEALVEDLVRLADSADNIDTVVANLADITTVADDLNEPVSEINTVAGAIANVNTVGNNISNVNTVAGISGNVTTVAGISANVTTVAGISANVTTVAGIAANVTSVAGNATNINAVAGNATNINAVNANKTNIDAVAGNATNINAVNANKTNIDTVATNAAAINTTVSNLAAIIDAPNQATAAANSAAAAAASAASGMFSAVQDKSADYTVVSGDAGDLIRVTTTGGARTITLPAISSVSDGFKVAIVKWTGDTNGVTVARSGSDTINGATSYAIGSQYNSATFVADAETAQWFAVASGLGSTNVLVDSFNGNGSTVAFTLSGDPGTENNTQVFVGGVYQEKDTYSVSGTTLTFSSAPPSGTSNIEVVWTQPLPVGVPGNDTVSTAKLQDSAVTTAKTANGAMTPAKLSTGAPTWDANGNSGVGATLAGWGTAYSQKAQQVGLVGSLSSLSAGAGNSQVTLGNNCYFDGANWKYIISDYASRYLQYGGQHVLISAPSGTAGANITFTELLTAEKDKSLALQGATPQTGTGITFPATQSASSNANTLDDYEEGTWTPTLGGSSSDPTATYNIQLGYYTKIGRQVTLYYYLYPATYSGGSGTLYIKGVPFTNGAANVVGSVYTSGPNWSTKTMALSYMPTTATFVRTICTASNAGDYDVQCNDVSAGDVIIGSITYFV